MAKTSHQKNRKKTKDKREVGKIQGTIYKVIYTVEVFVSCNVSGCHVPSRDNHLSKSQESPLFSNCIIYDFLVDTWTQWQLCGKKENTKLIAQI